MTGRRLLWLSGIAAAALFFSIAAYVHDLDPGVIALQLTFDKDSYRSTLNAWPAGGMHVFRTHFALDFPFLTSYGLFGYLLAQRTGLFARAPVPIQSILPWVLPMAALLDAVENLMHLAIVADFAAAPAALVFSAGIVATLKWLLIAGFATGAVLFRLGRR